MNLKSGYLELRFSVYTCIYLRIELSDKLNLEKNVPQNQTLHLLVVTRLRYFCTCVPSKSKAYSPVSRASYHIFVTMFMQVNCT